MTVTFKTYFFFVHFTIIELFFGLKLFVIIGKMVYIGQ